MAEDNISNNWILSFQKMYDTQMEAFSRLRVDLVNKKLDLAAYMVIGNDIEDYLKSSNPEIQNECLLVVDSLISADFDISIKTQMFKRFIPRLIELVGSTNGRVGTNASRCLMKFSDLGIFQCHLLCDSNLAFRLSQIIGRNFTSLPTPFLDNSLHLIQTLCSTLGSLLPQKTHKNLMNLLTQFLDSIQLDFLTKTVELIQKMVQLNVENFDVVVKSEKTAKLIQLFEHKHTNLNLQLLKLFIIVMYSGTTEQRQALFGVDLVSTLIEALQQNETCQDSLTCLTHISNGGSKQISLIVDSNGASTLSKLVHNNPFDQSVRCSSLKLLCHLIMYRELPKVTKQLNPTIINQLQKEVAHSMLIEQQHHKRFWQCMAFVTEKRTKRRLNPNLLKLPKIELNLREKLDRVNQRVVPVEINLTFFKDFIDNV